MDVVQIVSRMAAGGIPAYALFLTRELSKLGYSTSLIAGTLQQGYDADMSYMLRASDRVVWIPEMSRALSPSKDCRALLRLYKVLVALKPLIVHTHGAKAGLLGRIAARLAGVPVVIHTFHGHLFRGYFSRVVSAALCKLERLLARCSDAICVLSAQQACELSQTYKIADFDKLRIVPVGIPLVAFRELNGPPVSAHEECVVGWIGRFVPIKDLPFLCRVAERVFECTDRVRFLVAGDGPERNGVIGAEARFGSRRFSVVGWQVNVATVLEKCDVLIQTSLNEGTPLVLVQGMAARRPFVSTAVGGVVDMVRPPLWRTSEGARWFGNAVLVERDVSAFARVLCDLAEHKEWIIEMGCAAAALAESEYSAETMLRNIVGLYGELLDKRRVSSGFRLRASVDC
jgi:glycosyltransferase involved in cell wall biosynthesis